MSKGQHDAPAKTQSKLQPPRTQVNEAFGLNRDIERDTGQKTNVINHNKILKLKREPIEQANNAESIQKHREEEKIKRLKYPNRFGLLIPKMNVSMETLSQNPRIIDLRQKLNEITKKKEHDVDKETKTLLNDITQQLEEKNGKDRSGPYSLIFDLESQQTSSTSQANSLPGYQCDISEKSTFNSSDKCNIDFVHVETSKAPNVLNFQGKCASEFEYSCANFGTEKDYVNEKKPAPTLNPRSELFLQFKSQSLPRSYQVDNSHESPVCMPTDENSLDDSLGILTPDQMDDMCYIENAFSPTVESLPVYGANNHDSKNTPDLGDSPSDTDKTDTNSAASTLFVENDNAINAPLTSKNNTFIKETANLKNEPVVLVEAGNSSYDCCQNFNVVDFAQIDVKVTDSKLNNINDDNAYTKFNDDELLPSAHSSILESTSIALDKTVNLELPLGCKNMSYKCVDPQKIETTPSPEDLPLDMNDVNADLSTYSNSQESASTLHDTHSATDGTKSLETSKVSNSFVTSITSITSLDGYQGDGEMSRPVSRGADQCVDNHDDAIEVNWQNVAVSRRQDPMTDSDFFTESDADGLDDHMHRGDRKAQVIDGALYGGNNNNNNGNPPLIVNRGEDSAMESSGVYTDLENHRNSPVFLNAIDDLSPDGSTPSTRSELSQKNISRSDTACILEKKTSSKFGISNDSEIIASDGCKKTLICVQGQDTQNVQKSKEEKRFTLKKYKMPKRDVPSKLKTLLTGGKTDKNINVLNNQKLTHEARQRDSLIKKHVNETVEPKIKSFKDIKSKVDCYFSLQRSQTSCNVSRILTAKSTNPNNKLRSRHMRMRVPSEVTSTNVSSKSSVHSSQSDLSNTSTPLSKHAPGRFPATRATKKRESAPPAPAAQPPPRVPISPAVGPPAAKKNGVVNKLAGSPGSARIRQPIPASPRHLAPRKLTPAKPTSSLPVSTPTSTKEPQRAVSGAPKASKRVTPPSATPVPLPVPAARSLLPAKPHISDSLAHAAKGVEALGVLVQYLVFKLDALNSGEWKQEAERWRGLAATERNNALKASSEYQQRAQKDLDTITECLSKISELEREVAAKEEENARLQEAGAEAESQYRSTLQDVSKLSNEIKSLKNTIDALKQEVIDSRSRISSQSGREQVLRAQLDAARRDLAAQRCDSADTSTDYSYRNYHDQCDSRSQDSVDLCKSLDSTCDLPLEKRLNGESTFNGDEYVELQKDSSDLSKDKSELAAEVWSLRAVLELKQAEACGLRAVKSELAVERERRMVLERELIATRQAHEELRERAAARQREADRLKEENRRLREAAGRDRDRAARLSALSEELRYKLRQKSQVVSLLAGGATGGATGELVRGRALSEGGLEARSEDEEGEGGSPRPPAVKAVVEKHDSVSYVLEIEDTPEEVASRLARRSSFRGACTPGGGAGGAGAGSPAGGTKRRGPPSPLPPASPPAPASPQPNASKLFRTGELDYPHKLKESAGEAIYIYDDTGY